MKVHFEDQMFLGDCGRLGSYLENSSVQTLRPHPQSLLVGVDNFKPQTRLALSRKAHEPSFLID